MKRITEKCKWQQQLQTIDLLMITIVKADNIKN